MDDGEARRWRVSRVDKGAVRAVPATGTGDPETFRTGSDGTLPAVVGEPLVPAVGDFLHVSGGVARIIPRIAELVRDSAGRTAAAQVIAANVDTILIVEPLQPLPALGRIERLLTIAHRSGARPVVVLTKTDLVSDASYWRDQAAGASPGTAVLALSATAETGIEQLRAELAEAQTLVLVGPSGAGKSTLVNLLAGSEVMDTGQVRGDSRGMHTTTHRELVPLGNGQVLIDTPGLRSIGLVATDEAVEQTFTDIADLAAGCRFADCAHDVEPDCAVREAVERGDLPERRLASWRSLRAEALRQRQRADARAMAEANREHRRKTRSVRAARVRARR